MSRVKCSQVRPKYHTRLNTLLSLFARLAAVQAARPPGYQHQQQQQRPSPTGSHPQQAWDDVSVHRNNLMDDIKRVPVDHVKRMESIKVRARVRAFLNHYRNALMLYVRAEKFELLLSCLRASPCVTLLFLTRALRKRMRCGDGSFSTRWCRV